MKNLQERFTNAIDNGEFEGYENLSVMIDNVLPDDVLGIFYADGCDLFRPSTLTAEALELMLNEVRRLKDSDEISIVNERIIDEYK